MELVGRTYSLPKYRYGFNGKEKDDEVKGIGAQYDYGFRIYDPRIARFLSVDPLTKKYPELTPYQFASNTPIQGVDLDGLEVYYAADGSLLGKVGTNTQVKVVDANYPIFIAKQNIEMANSTNNVLLKTSFGTQALNAHSEALGMTDEELNTRSFLTMLRRSENDGNKALSYNTWNGFEDGKPMTFTDKAYADAPEDYKDHPGANPDNSPHSQSGAYQILSVSWETVIKPFV